MERQPRVSVLMPIWGQARFIRRAVDSLLAQAFQDWELLIVDDASPDDLERRYWSTLHAHGAWSGTGRAIYAWVDYPGQLYKLLRDPAGNVNSCRQRFTFDYDADRLIAFFRDVGSRGAAKPAPLAVAAT